VNSEAQGVCPQTLQVPAEWLARSCSQIAVVSRSACKKSILIPPAPRNQDKGLNHSALRRRNRKIDTNRGNPGCILDSISWRSFHYRAALPKFHRYPIWL